MDRYGPSIKQIKEKQHEILFFIYLLSAAFIVWVNTRGDWKFVCNAGILANLTNSQKILEILIVA